jgi:CRISPR/Cas system-associated endonuclease Cas3-HD
MSEADLVFKGKIKQKGIFGFKDFYEYLYSALVDEEYSVHETKYIEKILKDGSSKDVEIFWTAKRTISGYVRFEIKLDWLILGMKKVKVKKDDREVSMESGSLEIRFSASLIKDPSNKWNTPFFKILRKFYDKYIIRTRIEDYELKLYEHVNDIIANAKAYLALEGQHNSFY